MENNLITKDEFLSMHVLDQLKYAIEESLKEHRQFNTPYWKGSAFMGKSILETIEKLKEINNGQ